MMLAAALRWAERVPVFPCNPKDGAPLVARGFHAATTDPETITAMWTRWPNAMIGMPTGPASGIDVLDLDRKNGKDGFAAVPNWKDLSTIIVLTPHDGAHLWFKSDGSIRNTTSTIALGVDTRGIGGYVILPPSQNGDGAYRFANGGELDLANQPLFPAELQARLNIEPEQHEPNEDQLADDPAMVTAAMAAIPNDDLDWERWNRVGMACWAATGGSAAGRAAFDQFSQKSKKYNPSETQKRWRGLSKSQPTKIGFGTLHRLADEASPGWRKAYDDATMDVATRDALGAAAVKSLRENRAGNAPKPRINATPFVWIEPSKIPPREWLYKPHYIRKFLSAIFSPGGGAKSSKLIVEALAMVTCEPLLGVQPLQLLRVWYWNGEDPKEELDRRFAGACKHYGIKPEDSGDRLFIDSGRTMPIVIAEETKSGAKIAAPVIEQVIATLMEKQIDALIIDPFVSCHRVNENDNAAIERVAKTWAHIAEAANCSVMLAHHTRKTGGESVTVEDGRGASALRDAVRAACTLNTMTAREADDAEIEESERRLHFRCDRGKANLTPPAESADWFKLVSVDLENGPLVINGMSFGGDEVGVVTAWEYPQIDAPVIASSDIERAQAAIKAGGPWRADQRAKKEPWVGIPIAQALGFDLRSKPDKKVVAKLVNDWLMAGLLKRVDRHDSHYEARAYVEAGAKPVVSGLRGASDA